MRFKEKLRRIPRSKWAIPVPARAKGKYRHEGDTFDGMGYEDAEKLLEKLGFEELFTRTGYDFGDFRFMRPDRESNCHEEVKSLWVHRSGVFIQMGSYRFTDPDKGPVRRRLSSMDVSLEIDTGSYRGNYKKAWSAGRSGSGSTTPLLHGSNIHNRSFRVGAISDRGLLEILEGVQECARIAPFDKWAEGRYLYASNEVFFCPPLKDEDFGQEIGVLSNKYHDQVLEVFESIKPLMPPGLAPLLEESLTGHKQRRMCDMIWNQVEDTLDYYTRNLEAAGVCWPKPAEAELLEHWSGRIADYEAPNDWDKDRIGDLGPAGVNYATALLYSIGRPGNETRFLDLISNASENELRKWSTVPDACGLTLVSHLVALAGAKNQTTSSGLLDRAASLDHLKSSLELLTTRLDPATLSLGSSSLSVATLIRKNINEGDKHFDAGDFLMVGRMVEMIEKALDLGVQWGPSTLENEDDFQFIQQSYADWPGIKKFVSIWERHQLASLTEQAPPPARVPRSRL